MFKIEFTAASEADIPNVAAVMARLAAALAGDSHVQSVSVSETTARKPGRPRKSADPVEAYVAAGGVLPGISPVQMVVEAQAVRDEAERVADLLPDTAPSAEPTPAAPAALDALRAQIRTIAQERGALWLRPLLEADKVTKVSGLTEATMRAALAEAGK